MFFFGGGRGILIKKQKNYSIYIFFPPSFKKNDNAHVKFSPNEMYFHSSDFIYFSAKFLLKTILFVKVRTLPLSLV